MKTEIEIREALAAVVRGCITLKKGEADRGQPRSVESFCFETAVNMLAWVCEDKFFPGYKAADEFITRTIQVADQQAATNRDSD
jgi:hypothetical protein